MNKPLLLVGILASVGAAFATQDLRPTREPGWLIGPRRTRVLRGLDAAPAVPSDPGAPTPEPAAPDPAAGGPAAAEPAAAEPVVPPKPDGSPPAPAPRPELHTVTDVDLCTASNALHPPFGRSNEIHIGIEGEMTWHAGGESVEIPSEAQLAKSLDQKFEIVDTVFCPDRESVWQALRLAIRTAQKRQRAEIWLGVANEDENDKLRVLKLFQTTSADQPEPEGEVFRIELREAGSTMSLSVNGKEIADFPAGLAFAWSEWKKARGGKVDTSDPVKTPVILDVHRFTPCQMVVSVIDVMRGLGIESEYLAGELSARRR